MCTYITTLERSDGGVLLGLVLLWSIIHVQEVPFIRLSNVNSKTRPRRSRISVDNNCGSYRYLGQIRKEKDDQCEESFYEQKNPVQKAMALEKLAAAHQSIFAPHSQGICVASMMPTAIKKKLDNGSIAEAQKLTYPHH